MAEVVQRAERLREPGVQGTTAVRTGVPDDDLVGLRAQAGLSLVDGRLGVVDGLEALDVLVLAEVGEQLAALGYLGDELLPADGLPLALAALAGALQRDVPLPRPQMVPRSRLPLPSA